MSVMEAYWPADVSLFLWLLVGLVMNLTVGFVLMRLARILPLIARIGSWLLLMVCFFGFSWLCQDAPAGFRMLAIIGMVLFSMKAIVGVEVNIAAKLQLGVTEWVCWSALWPGMAPEIFVKDKLGRQAEDTPTAQQMFSMAVVRVACGILLLVLARTAWGYTNSWVWATVFVLPGISLILHFGIFNFLSAFWRWFGVPTYLLFPAPLTSYTLAEFWGRRWNLPFTEMIQRSVYRPLSKVIGRKGAAFTGFVFSGLLHECAISHPVQQGYGLPMLYFLIHGVLVWIERSTGLANYLQMRPIMARVWTLFWLAMPMPILFHKPFLTEVVFPLIGI